MNGDISSHCLEERNHEENSMYMDSTFLHAYFRSLKRDITQECNRQCDSE